MNSRLIDNNLRLSRITEEKMNMSVDGISSSRGNSVINHINDSTLNNGNGDDNEKNNHKGKNANDG